MVVISRNEFRWLLSVVVFVALSSTNALAKNIQPNPENTLNSTLNQNSELKTMDIDSHKSIRPTSNLSTDQDLGTRRGKTSFKCGSKFNNSLCNNKLPSSKNRSSAAGKGAFQSRQLSLQTESNNHHRSDTHSEYLPVPYGPYGYQDEVSEGRGWVTVPLFIIFSIIQFKLVAAIFLALFGPMVLFLLVVQGFLFKVTLVLLGLMMF